MSRCVEVACNITTVSSFHGLWSMSRCAEAVWFAAVSHGYLWLVHEGGAEINGRTSIRD